jgi:hypothetical protein
MKTFFQEFKVTLTAMNHKIYLSEFNLTHLFQDHEIRGLTLNSEKDSFDFKYFLFFKINAKYSARTYDRFDTSFGNWLPGDPEEMVMELYLGETDVTEFISSNEYDKISDQIVEYFKTKGEK